MKKQDEIAIFIVVLVAVISTLFFFVSRQGEEIAVQKSFKIGVSTYDSSDTFISYIMSNLEQEVKAYEKQTGFKIDLDISAAEGNQRIQNEKIERYIDLDYDVLCINLVDRTDTIEIISAALEIGIPILFFNREPAPEDIENYENFYYLGVDSYESALLQSELISTYWKENKEIIDKNGDGILDYVMLEGETGHQDTILRSRFVIEQLNQNEIPTNKIDSKIANWNRSQAYAITDTWYRTYGNEIEMIICNNDDMALGAVDALKLLEEEQGAVSCIPIVGIDATQVALESIEKGELIGTVDAGATGYAKGIMTWAMQKAGRDDYESELKITDQKYINVPMKIVYSPDF
ncbi:MAG: galactose ABC transporter substrate-binding protein [Bacillota bacterium]